MAETSSHVPVPGEGADEQGSDSPIDTERLRALLAASTPGPWANAPWHHETVLPARWIDGDQDGTAPEDRGPFGAFHTFGRDNATLVAEALTALPALLDEVDRLRSDRAAAYSVIRRLDDSWDYREVQGMWVQTIYSHMGNPPERTGDRMTDAEVDALAAALAATPDPEGAK